MLWIQRDPFIRIANPDPEGKNDQKIEFLTFSYFCGSAGCSLLRVEDFSFCLDILYVGLGKSKLQLLIKKD